MMAMAGASVASSSGTLPDEIPSTTETVMSAPPPLSRSSGTGPKSRFRTMTFPRKRAVTACDTCRWKKTKCGNERPRCASCAKHDWPCSYDPRLDHASFDPASLLILEKLNQTLDKLSELSSEVKKSQTPNRNGNGDGAGSAGTGGVAGSESLGGGDAINDWTSTMVAPSRTPPSAIVPHIAPSLHSRSDCLEVPTDFGSTDAVLTWPVFHGRFPRSYLSHEILVGLLPSTSGDPRHSPLPGLPSNRGINEEIVPGLVNRFLQLVHPKNPVFYARQIHEAARHVAEHGIGWDAMSCIILLACALGAIASPYDPSNQVGMLNERTSLADIFVPLETGDTFYQVARKRLGLLDQSITACQCHVLSGIYLMYTLHPIEAWSAFHQAGSTYSLHLRSHAALQERNVGVDISSSQSEKRLEQRLYWTILKSECEIRVQLDLPQSDLYKLDYPVLFPSPPTPASPAVDSPDDLLYSRGPASTGSISSQQLSTNSSSQGAEQQSWFYYLSEIALRRIENRILNTFYNEEHPHWTRMDLASMVNAAEEIETQMETWYASLPSSIAFDHLSHKPFDELRYATQGRSLLMRGLLYRPFLYLAIHAAHKVQSNWDLSNTVQSFVEKALTTCVACNAGNAITHRHHGTWYALRESVTSALLLLAAGAANLITLDMQAFIPPQEDDSIDDSQQYSRTVHVCLETLRYWEAEAPPDITRARAIIEEMIGGMEQG